jgi:heme/copper-type cytochrome/quinol oxidase subunit 2
MRQMVYFRKYGLIGIVVFGFLLMAFAPLPIPKSEPQSHSFRLVASSYAFTPSEIKVNPGDQVIIELTSSDVVHGLYLDGYELQVSADPGQTETLTFVADRPGTFRMRCSVTCGDLHPFMIGKLRVGPNTLLWRSIGLAVMSIIAILTIKPDYPIKRFFSAK